MAKIAKKPVVTKKVTTSKKVMKKPVVKKTTQKPACKCTSKCKSTKVQKVSVKSIKKTPVIPKKKSFWTKVAEFFGF